MARSLSITLSLSKTHRLNSLLPSATLLSSRSQSSHRRGDLHEIDTASSSPSDALVQKLEDAVYRISARRAAPDWLPFVPGSSYWVPPPGSESHSRSIALLVAQMANPLNRQKPISSNSNINSSHGWPSSDYFLRGVEPQVTETSSNTESQSEEEEG